MNRPEAVVVIPTLGVKGFVFRLLNHLEVDRPVVFEINDSPSLSVAAKWNIGLARAIALECPALFLNDDILPWPGAVAAMLDSPAKFVTGITTRNLPGEGPPQKQTSGGFSMFCLKHTASVGLAEFEEWTWLESGVSSLIEEHWPSNHPRYGYFDENFHPAYFEDSDYYHRLKVAGIKETVLEDAAYYHELTRTGKKVMIGCSTNLGCPERWSRHERWFALNHERYMLKWDGEPHNEKNTRPFQHLLKDRLEINQS